MGLTHRIHENRTGRTAARLRAAVLTIALTAALWGCAKPPSRPSFMPEPPDPRATLLAETVGRGEVFAYIPEAEGGPRAVVGETPSVFIQFALSSDYILLGEGHGTVCDHLLQARIAAAFATAGAAPVIGLEQVGTDYQPVLDRFNAGELSLSELPDALDWKKMWGHTYEAYEPIFATAQRLGIPLQALNAPKKAVSAFREAGSLELVESGMRSFLPDRLIPPPEGQVESLRKQFELHGAMLKSGEGGRDSEDTAEAEARRDAMLQRFLDVQSLWDTAMAERAVELRRSHGGPVLILTGAGHVEYGWGVAHRLKVLDPDGRSVLLVPWRGTRLPEPEEADYFFHCPLRHRSRLGFVLEWREGRAEVVDIRSGSRAEASGVKVRDIITAVDGEPLENLWTLHLAGLKAREAGRPMVLTVERNGGTLSLPVEVSSPATPLNAPPQGTQPTEDKGKD